MLAAEDTETSSPRFTHDFVVSQLDEFLGEVSELAQIKNFILLAVHQKPHTNFLNAISFLVRVVMEQ